MARWAHSVESAASKKSSEGGKQEMHYVIPHNIVSYPIAIFANGQSGWASLGMRLPSPAFYLPTPPLGCSPHSQLASSFLAWLFVFVGRNVYHYEDISGIEVIPRIPERKDGCNAILLIF